MLLSHDLKSEDVYGAVKGLVKEWLTDQPQFLRFSDKLVDESVKAFGVLLGGLVLCLQRDYEKSMPYRLSTEPVLGWNLCVS